jgi:hypothetical protein
MIKCDKVYIPKQDGPYVINTSWGQFDTEFADSAFNVIVLTIEELRECFVAGMKYCEGLETSNYNGRPDFAQFIESKGIKLDSNG